MVAIKGGPPVIVPHQQTPVHIGKHRHHARAPENGPGLADTVVDGTGGILQTMAMVPFVGPVVLGPLGSGLGWIGKKTGLKTLETAGSKVRAPIDYLNRSLEDALPTSVMSGMQGAADKSAVLIEKATDRIGLSGWQQGRHAGKAHRALLKTRKLAGGINHTELPAALAPHVKEIQDMIKGAGHLGHVDMSRFTEAVTKVSHAIETNPHVREATSAVKGFDKFMGAAGHLADHHAAVHSWANVSESVRGVPKSLSKAQLGHTMMNGAFVGMSALSMFGDARGFKQNLASLKQMYADMTGKDVRKVSTLGVLLGSVPAPIREARSHLIKNFLIKESTDAVGMAVNIKGALDHKFNGFKAMAAYMIPDQIAGMADSYMGPSVLPVYKAFAQAHKSGQEIPRDFYAAFIGIASPELRARGGGESAFTQAIAAQYAAERASPAQILKEIENGKLLGRINDVIAASEAAKTAQATVSGNANLSHTDRLGGAKSARPIVGEHTGRLDNSTPGIGQGIAPT